jgi:hypothetical protein
MVNIKAENACCVILGNVRIKTGSQRSQLLRVFRLYTTQAKHRKQLCIKMPLGYMPLFHTIE